MATDLPPEQRASYTIIIDKILADADLNKVSAKAIRQGIQSKVGYDLSHQKTAITALILERFDKVQSEQVEASDDAARTVETHEPAPTVNGTKHAAGHDTSPSKKRKADVDESQEDDLSEVEDSPAPKKVKKSKVKSEAQSDEALAAKLQAEFNAQARSTRGGRSAKKKSPVKKEKRSKKKSAAKVKAEDDSDLERSDSSDKPVAEREKKGGFHQLMTLSEPLSAMLGEPALSRPQTVKKIWEYVKARDLQDPGDKRQIRCDHAMRAVFKQDKVHMFTMNKLLASHLYPQGE